MANAPDPEDPNALALLRRDLGRALSLMEKKRPDYVKAREMYEGKAREIAGSSIAKAIIEQNDATPISFAHVPVDVLSDKVTLTGISTPDATARRYLESWYEANDIDDEGNDWILKACYFGDYYVVTDPTGLDNDDNFTVEDIDSIGMSPLSTIVIYDKKTQRIPLYGVHTWDSGTETEPETSAVLYYDDASVRLVTVSGKSTDAKDYTLDVPAGEDAELADAWLYHDGERMLIDHLPIGSKPYGTPVHRRAWAFQDAIAKISANNLVNVDAQGLPSRWALLDPVAEIDDDIDDDFGTDGPSTIVSKRDGQRDATSGRRVRSLPGAIAMLRGVKQTGTYDTGDSAGFLTNLDWYVRGMAVAEGIPLFEFDMSGEQPSGESRRRAEARANRRAARIARKARTFFEHVAGTVLALVGASGDVVPTFAPVEMSTDKEGIELVGAKIKAGVPIRVALAEAGYTAEQIEEWYPRGAPAFSPESVALIAEALGKLGNAVTLGAITDEHVAAMLPELFSVVGSVPEGPVVEPEIVTEREIVTNPGTEIKTKADAMGVLIRSGVDQIEAAAAVGLPGLSFPNLPTTIRVPEEDAAGIEAA